MRFDRSHPLASKSGRVLTYRASLYSRIGPGTHPCSWCAAPVTWTVVSSRGRKTCADLVVDHLDGDPRNNDPGNLVPACSRCNVLRGLLNAWLGITGKRPEVLVNVKR